MERGVAGGMDKGIVGRMDGGMDGRIEKGMDEWKKGRMELKENKGVIK